jgi:hypothetical protein
LPSCVPSRMFISRNFVSSPRNLSLVTAACGDTRNVRGKRNNPQCADAAGGEDADHFGNRDASEVPSAVGSLEPGPKTPCAHKLFQVAEFFLPGGGISNRFGKSHG